MVEAKKHILTSQGMQALEDELQDLKVVKRKEIAQKIKEAREQGDLSENAEYDAAKDEQRSMEARIEELEKIIKNAEVIDESAYDKDVECSLRRSHPTLAPRPQIWLILFSGGVSFAVQNRIYIVKTSCYTKKD